MSSKKEILCCSFSICTFVILSERPDMMAWWDSVCLHVAWKRLSGSSFFSPYILLMSSSLIPTVPACVFKKLLIAVIRRCCGTTFSFIKCSFDRLQVHSQTQEHMLDAYIITMWIEKLVMSLTRSNTSLTGSITSLTRIITLLTGSMMLLAGFASCICI